MQRTGLRATVAGAEVDIPTGTWTSGQFLRFNGTAIDSAAGGGGGGIAGPGVTVVGNVVTWNDITGTTVADAGFLAADVVRQFAGSVTNGNLAQYNSTTGRGLIDSGIPAIRAVTNIAGTAVVGNIPSFTNTLGNDESDSGIAAAVVPRFTGGLTSGGAVFVIGTSPIALGSSASLTSSTLMSSTIGSSGTGNVVSFLNAGGRQLADGGVLAANLVTNAANAAGAGNIMTSAGASRVIQDSGVAIANLPTFDKACKAAGQTISVANTLTDVTGMSFAIPAAGSYVFDFNVVFNNSTATASIGVAASYSGTAPTAFSLGGIVFLSASTVANVLTTTAGAVSTLSGTRTIAISTNTNSVFSGVMTVSNAGTLQFRMQTSVVNLVINAASGGRCTKV